MIINEKEKQLTVPRVITILATRAVLVHVPTIDGNQLAGSKVELVGAVKGTLSFIIAS